MKIDELMEELMPRSNTPKAEAIAKDMVEAIIQRYGKGSDSYQPEVLAKKMAAAFHQAIVSAIDEELKYRNMAKVSPHGREGSFNAKA